MNWVCVRVNCGLIYVGGRCFIFNSIWDYFFWVFNVYFNSMNGVLEFCNFLGIVYISLNDLSKYFDVVFLIEWLLYVFNI